MAFTVEDGTGVADANAYIDVAFADAYFLDRGNSVWSAATEANKETAIVRATDYIETRFGGRFRGQLASDATTLSWPRDYVYDRKGELVELTIPDDVKKACAEYALRALSATLMPDPALADDSGRSVRRTFERVGPIETELEYEPGGSVDLIRSYPAADKLLNFWLNLTGGVIR